MTKNWNQNWQDDNNKLLSVGPSARSRRRLIFRLINKHAKGANSFLDVGCGTGELLSSVEKTGQFSDINGIDISETALTQAKQNCPSGNFRILDIEKTVLFKKFDIITCLATLELNTVGNDEAAIENMAGMLNPSGHLILAVQHGNKYWNKLDEKYNLRRYEMKDLKEKCAKTGLKCVEMFSWGWPLYNIYYRLMVNAESNNIYKINGHFTKFVSNMMYYLFFFDDIFPDFNRGRWLFGAFEKNGL